MHYGGQYPGNLVSHLEQAYFESGHDIPNEVARQHSPAVTLEAPILRDPSAFFLLA